jgi:PAS domain S-box-containing protein
LAGFAVALALLTGVSWFGWRHTTHMQETAALVAHTERGRAAWIRLTLLIERVQSEQRGYLLTGQPAFRTMFEDSLKSVEQQLRLLAQWNQDAELKVNLAALKPLLAERVAFARRNVDLRQNAGLEAATQELLTLKGKNLTDQIGAQIARIDTREQALLDQRATQAGRETNTLFLLGVTGSGLSFALLIAVFALVRRESRQRQAANLALRISEESLAITLNSIGDGVLATDAHGRVTRLNPVAEALTGWTTAEAAGRPVGEVFRIINEHTRAPTVIPVDEVLRSGRIVGLANHTILIARDGTEWPIADSAAPIRDREGKIRGVVLVFRDQTRELEAQRAIHERERLLTSIHQNLIGSFVYRVEFSPAGRMTCSYVSPNVEEITGLPPADFLADGEKFFSLVLLNDVPLLKERVGASMRSGELLDVEVRLTHARDRSLRWLRLRGRSVERRPDGAEVREGIAIDITAAKEAEAENRVLALVAARTVNGVVLTDPRACIEWVNEGFTRVTGYTLDEVRGRVLGSFLQGPETDPAVVAQMRAALRAGRGFHVELINYAKDGRKYWVEIEIQPLRDADGRLTHFMELQRDVTERKAAENEVRRLNASLETQVRQRTETLALSEERFRRLAENMRDLLCMIDESGRFAYVSPSFHTVLDYSVEDLLGSDALEAVHRDDHDRAFAALQEVLHGGPAQTREFRFRHKAGHYVWLETNASAVRSIEGAVKGCVVTARDITERKDTAERLRDSEQRFAHLVENVHDAIIRDDLAGRIVFANHRFVDWFGLAGRDLQSVTIEGYVAPEWRAALRDRHDRRVRGEEVSDRFEFEGLRADGRHMWLDVFVTPVQEHGRIVGTQSVIRDITARKQSEQAAQAVLSKTALVVGAEFYRALVFELGRAFDVALVCITRIPAPGRLRPLAHYSDGQMLEVGEFEVPAGHPCEQVVSRGEPIHIATGVRHSYPAGVCGRLDFEGYYGIPLRAGNRPVQGLLIIASTQPLRLEPLQLSLLNILTMRTEAEFVREQTELEQAQMQTRLFQSQKYEALGTLAGGVAHDFNNILTGVLNYTALAREDCPPSHPQIREFLDEVLTCGNRAKDLVRQILLFSRPEDSAQEPVLLQVILKETLALLRSTLPATAKFEADLDRRAPAVIANPTQLHQVIMNLVINAAHALAGKPGRITLRLQMQMLDAAAVRALPELQPGPHVRLDVTDTGSGMDEHVVARIFEPFFTTKPVGEGTGLGLAVVHSVVRSHRGAITVRSHRGAGTTFELYFPAAPVSAAGPGPAAPELPRGHGQRILFVDDEVTVAKSVRLLLERLGYKVTIFTNPGQALAKFRASPDEFAAVITDFQMPGMTGGDLAKKILALRPKLPVFVASGFAGKMTTETMRAEGVADFLHKPFALAALAETLAHTFGPAGPAPR